jgi:hypothetical protein
MLAIIGGYCKSDKLIITISFLVSLLRVVLILFLVVVLRNTKQAFLTLLSGKVFNLESIDNFMYLMRLK